MVLPQRPKPYTATENIVVVIVAEEANYRCLYVGSDMSKNDSNLDVFYSYVN